MRQLDLPFYAPCFPAPERAVLTVLHAALRVAEQALRDEHPLLHQAPSLAEHHAPIVVACARLITDRCVELRALLDFYDAAVDHTLGAADDRIPF
jgi:hypothetical protein